MVVSLSLVSCFAKAEVQPSRKKRVSDSPAGSGREAGLGCQLCQQSVHKHHHSRDIWPNQAPAKKKRIPDTPTREKWGMPAGLQSRLSGFLDVSARAEISSGPWNRVRICGDGNCLFTAAAVGHRALKSGTLEMDAVKQRQWGKTNRAVQMQWMEQHQGQRYNPKPRFYTRNNPEHASSSVELLSPSCTRNLELQVSDATLSCRRTFSTRREQHSIAQGCNHCIFWKAAR